MLTVELLDWAIRISLLLVVGYLIARVLELRSAAMAHRMLVATAGCVLLVPLATAVIPSWQWTKPAWASIRTVDVDDTAPGSPAAVTSSVTTLVAAGPSSVPHAAPLHSGDVGLTSAEALTLDQASINIAESRVALDEMNPVSSQSRTAVLPDPVSAPIRWTRMECLAALWLSIAGLLAAQIFVAILRLSRFVSSCSAAPHDLAQMVNNTALRLGLNRRISVVLSEDDTMPTACWLGRWIIVLPTNIASWSDELQEATLVHELGHIARRDAWSDFLVQGVACLLWPNPFSWLAVRDVRRLRERACDEWALQKSDIGVRAYAQGLLEVVHRCQTRRLRFASAMAGKKDFESRLRWMLSASRPKVARPVIGGMMVLALLGLGLAIASAEPTGPQETQEQIGPQESGRQDAVRTDESPEVIVSDDPAPATPTISVWGVVLDSDGNPLAGMHVVLCGQLGFKRNLLARTTTNAKGWFAFTGIRVPPRMVELIKDLREGKTGASLFVWGEGKALAWEPIRSFRERGKKIRLKPEANVSGTLVDTDGHPLDNVKLRVARVKKATDSDSTGSDDAGELSIYYSAVQLGTTSNKGRFSVPNLPEDSLVSIGYLGPTGQLGTILVDTGSGTATTATIRDRRGKAVEVYRTPIKATIEQHPWVKIRVVDHNGNPVSSGSVEAVDTERHFGGVADVGEDGIAILAVREPGEHQVTYAQDPLSPTIAMTLAINIQSEPSPTVEIKLVASRMLTGKVIDGDSGVPVVGAYVLCSSQQPIETKAARPSRSTAVTGADGVFHLPVTEGHWSLTFLHDVNGYFMPSFGNRRIVALEPEKYEITVTEDDVPDDIVLKVSRGLVVTGRVFGDNGQPQFGLSVRAQSERYRTVFAITDESGRFELSGLSPYAPTHVSTLTESGTAGQTIPAKLDHPWEKALTRTIVLNLARGTALAGRVLKDGKPASGINVKLFRSPPKPPGQDWSRFSLLSDATTDEDGRYEVIGLHKGDEYRLEIEPSDSMQVRDWRYQSPYFHRLESEDGGTIELPDATLVSNGQQLVGRVVDPDGNPVDGVSVSASLASGRNISRLQDGPPPWTKTDAEGQFRLINLPDEPLSLMAYRANPAGGRIRYPSRVMPEMNATDIRIVLDPTLGTDIEDLDAE